MKPAELEQSCVNTIRFLSVDMVEQAKSGHPGLPMGAAPMAYVLWTRFLRHNPRNPRWWDRDRFVLSAGHGSALLYSLLHLTGYDLSLDQLKRFRQWQSKTPGHPESHVTDGVEASTGPLGQGVGNALGMAIGEAHLAARYNRERHELFHHFTYVLASDGDMMEGVQSEAACDANETRWAWQTALEQRDRPAVLVLTRQDVPTLDRGFSAPAELLRRGAYVLNPSDARTAPDVILIASGSEVALIVAAEPILRKANVSARLVSMPSWRLFEEQTEEYRQSVLPMAVTARLSVEAASPLGWERWTGLSGAVLGIDRFGASAPGEVVFNEYGFTVKHVVDQALALLHRSPKR